MSGVRSRRTSASKWTLAPGGTEQVEAILEIEEKLRLTIEYSPAAIAMLDTDMRYIGHSRRWISDYDLGQENLIGRSHYDIFPEISERWREAYRRSLRGEIVKGDEDRFVRQSGDVQWLHWEVRPWYRGKRIGGIIIFSEVITNIKEKEAELQNVKLLQEELASVAHSAKSPASAANLLVELLEKGAHNLSPEQCDLLRGIADANKNTLIYLRNILLLSNLPEHSATDPAAWTNFGEVVQNVLTRYGADIRRKGH